MTTTEATTVTRADLLAKITEAKRQHDRLPVHYVEQREARMAEVFVLVDRLLALDG